MGFSLKKWSRLINMLCSPFQGILFSSHEDRLVVDLFY